ncbi:MAG: hypothetical protein V4585_00195 [Bacteroidota bacterium]
MKKLSLLSIILFSLGMFSCAKKDNTFESIPRGSNVETLTSQKWKIEKVTQLIEGRYQIIYDRNTSLFDLDSDFSSLKMKFFHDKTMKIFTKGNIEEAGKWEFINHESQIKSKKVDQKSFIVLHINRIEKEELVFTQTDNGKIIQYDFSPM